MEMNRSKMRASIEAGYNTFRGLLAEFDTEQMCRPSAVGKWSLKDTLAHIVVHEQRMLAWIAERLCGRHPLTFQPYAMPDDELDKLNEQIYQENLHRPLEDILQDLDSTHAEALRLVETSPEEDILGPDRFQLQGGEPLWAAIAANTFEHYEEHGQAIHRWRTSAPAVPGGGTGETSAKDGA